MKADLHCHTVLSDGAMRVDQIMPYAKRIGLDILQSLTTNQHIPFRKLLRLGKELGVHAGSFMMGYTGTPIGQLHNELFRAGGPHKFPYRYMDAKTVTDLLHPAEALSCLHILAV
mgnify:CR=1 FL=1